MLMKGQEKLSCDVLVIGGGGAGLRSAIAAGLCNADVLLASKTKIGIRTNTYISKAIIASTGWGSSDDDETVHIVDTVRGGRFLNDQSMVAHVAERTHSEIAFLKDCGVNFHMHAGKLRVLKIPGHRYSRHVYGENWRGSDLVMPLMHRAKQIGVRFAENVFISRLITDADRICGAAGISPDGRFFVIHAKTIILATGGYAQIFLNTNNVPGITGDGQALAYDLGIPLKDLEFIQFYPTAAGKHGSRLILYEKMLAQPGVTLCNGQGENILKRHGIPDSTQVTRDQLAQLVTREIRQGGAPGQGVFMDLSGLSEETARQLSSFLPSRWWKGQKTIEVTPTAHFCMGGIVTDPIGETPLKGLFAVGEATAGVHGANRLGGNALAEIFTMGSWVGQMAAERSRDIGTSITAESAFAKEHSRLEEAFSKQGSSVKASIAELKQLMWDKVGVIRRKSELEEALKHLNLPLPRIAAASPTDLIRLLEFKNMHCVAQMVCRAALERTESRGSHFRTDYPAEDNQMWLKNIVLRKSDSKITIEARPVRLDLVELAL
jgi:succinate dehydrogenase/fumarate reductase flavoprotein subunit